MKFSMRPTEKKLKIVISSRKMMFSSGFKTFLMIKIRFSVLNHKEFRAIVVMPSANSYGICFQKWPLSENCPKISKNNFWRKMNFEKWFLERIMVIIIWCEFRKFSKNWPNHHFHPINHFFFILPVIICTNSTYALAHPSQLS